MERTHILYILVALLLILDFVVLYIAVKCAHRVPDDFEFYDEDGDHIYYDRKYIAQKRESQK
ncbi:MAG: hypothetical protein SNI87_08185 [Rikenellaceae bacterium]